MALKLGAHSAAHGDVSAALKTDRYVWFITGPTACGKTTVAKYLAEKLNLTFLEGDDVGVRVYCCVAM
jgi:cytidylate kinase